MNPAEVIERLSIDAKSLTLTAQLATSTLADLVLALEEMDVHPCEDNLMAAAVLECSIRTTPEARYWTGHFNNHLIRISDGGF